MVDRWKVGDVLVFQSSGIDPLTDQPFAPVYRRILEVHPTGYDFCYIETPHKTFRSEWSNDPFMKMGWKKEPRDE